MKRNDEEKNHELKKKKKNQISRKGYIFFVLATFLTFVKHILTGELVRRQSLQS